MKKLHSTSSFWLLLGIFLLGGSVSLLWGTFLAVLIHELGHNTAIRLLGGRVDCIRLTGTGVEMLPHRNRVFSYEEECLIALAGPVASYLLAFLVSALARESESSALCLLAGLSFLLGTVNLLPVGNLDGGRIFRSLISPKMDPGTFQKWSRRATVLVSAGLAGIGGSVCCKTGNFTLCLMALWLLSDTIE